PKCHRPLTSGPIARTRGRRRAASFSRRQGCSPRSMYSLAVPLLSRFAARAGLVTPRQTFVRRSHRAAKLPLGGPYRISDRARAPALDFWELSVSTATKRYCLRSLARSLACQSTVWRLRTNVWRGVTSPNERAKRQTVEFHLQQGFAAMLDRHVTRR